MTFWEFLDRQIGRISPAGVAGAGIFALTGVVLVMLSDDKELANNDLFKTLAQAIIVQGLVGLAMASWFTKNRGEATGPTGTPSDPVSIEGVPGATTPVTVTEASTKTGAQIGTHTDLGVDPWKKG